MTARSAKFLTAQRTSVADAQKHHDADLVDEAKGRVLGEQRVPEEQRVLERELARKQQSTEQSACT